jgi:hypothetical protein
MSNLGVLKARVQAAEGHGVPVLVVARVELRELVDELARLQAAQHTSWGEGYGAGWNDCLLDLQNGGVKMTPNPYPEPPEED